MLRDRNEVLRGRASPCQHTGTSERQLGSDACVGRLESLRERHPPSDRKGETASHSPVLMQKRLEQTGQECLEQARGHETGNMTSVNGIK